MKGGKTKGGMYTIGEPGDRTSSPRALPPPPASTRRPACALVAAFNCGGLEPVARAIREKHPTAQSAIAADDDRETPATPA